MTGRVLRFDPAPHKVADVLLPWLVNGTLEGDELEFVQQHVATCVRCQREVEWLREFHAACAAGESNASVAPKLTPNAPSPARPTVRTEKYSPAVEV